MQSQYTPANSSGESPCVFDTSETGVSTLRQAAKPLRHRAHMSTWPIVSTCEARP